MFQKMSLKEKLKVLVVSNACLSLTGSNGRTLRNLLFGWPKEKLAQFYTQNQDPDPTICDIYYRVTDQEALNAFLHKRSGSTSIQEKGQAVQSVGKNAFTKYLREIVWSSGRWGKKKLIEEVKRFAPDLLLFQAGDNAFLCDLTYELSQKMGVPVVIYNSENYYFKNYDYFRARGIKHLFYKPFHRRFRKALAGLIRHSSFCIYSCDGLKEIYDTEFRVPSCTIYTSTDLIPVENKGNDKTFIVSYLGNLGVGRHKPLIEIAEVLHSISPDLYLDVYGKIPNQIVQDSFDKCEAIRYQGFVSYDQVKDVMTHNDLLVHAESFDEYYKKDLQFAFSTKIADCLASGVPFLLYAPDNLDCVKYLQKHNAAFVVTEKARLRSVFELLISSRECRSQYLDCAKSLCFDNHNIKKNSDKLEQIVKDILGSSV